MNTTCQYQKSSAYRLFLWGLIALGYWGMLPNVQAQGLTVKGLLEKTKAYYETRPSYRVAITYNMYRGLTGNDKTESYSGSIVKEGGAQRVQLLETELLHFPDCYLRIDHASKVMTYEKSVGQSIAPMLDISSFLERYDRTVVIEEEDAYRCEMVPSKPDAQTPYGKVVLYIDKTDFSCHRQLLYFSRLIPFKEGKGQALDYGRLEVTMMPQRMTGAPLVRDDYVRVRDAQVIPQGKYEKYRLIAKAN